MSTGYAVVIGTGHGELAPREALKDKRHRGSNALAGNLYITDADQAAIDIKNGGRYVVAETTPGINGAQALQTAAERAAREEDRLFGVYGTTKYGTTASHLPYRTADGNYGADILVDGGVTATMRTNGKLEAHLA